MHFQHRAHSQAPLRIERGARHPGTSIGVPGAWKGGAYALQPKALFYVFFVKSAFLAQNQVETFSINTAFLIHYFLVQNEVIQEEGEH